MTAQRADSPIRPLDHLAEVDVTIIMPCLNEATSLPYCIANAKRALLEIQRCYGLRGEILVADNGSSDGSRALAGALGVRVEPVEQPGYGAALIGGCEAANGRLLLMGDADGSYNFCDGVGMIGELLNGADLCMGSRFRGTIEPGAMPWKNRYIGNPVLSGMLNLFFRAGVSDAHCGLRAISKEAFRALDLSGTGMEFASEMVVKAALRRLRIAEVPATLAPDLRGRPPHLRPWRDGWRHLRFLLMLSPTWLFVVPALASMGLASVILGIALIYVSGLVQGVTPFGNSWTIAAGFLFTTGHLAAVIGLAVHLHAVRSGHHRLPAALGRYARLLTLESMLVCGSTMAVGAVFAFIAIGQYWSANNFAALSSSLPVVLAAVLGTTGMQTIFGAFLTAILSGHDANFVTGALRHANRTPQFPGTGLASESSSQYGQAGAASVKAVP